MVATLLAVGVLRLPASTSDETLKASLTADVAAFDHQPTLLSAALDSLRSGGKVQSMSSLKAKRTRDEPLSLHSQQEGDRDLLQLAMQCFSFIAVYLNEQLDQPTPPQLVAFLCGHTYEVSVMPVGSWQPVRSDVEIYHHWKSTVLPALPVSWEGLDRAGRLTNIARHCLHYHELHGEVPVNTVRADGGEASYFDNKVKMSHWSNKLIQSAWSGVPALPWTSLRTQQSTQNSIDEILADELVSAPRPGTFSLDMPRRVTSQRKRHQEGSAAKLSQSARKKAKSEATQDSGGAAHAFEAVELVVDGEVAGSGLDGESTDATDGPAHLMDPGLEEEVQSLLACEDIEWTTRQVCDAFNLPFARSVFFF